MKLGIVAGEVSGDLLGKGLLHSLNEISETKILSTGIGGPRMLELGFNSLYPMERLSVMGFVDPLLRLPELFKIRSGLYQHFSNNLPDIFVGIDAPDFNLGLEVKLRKKGIKVVHYVSPSVWAWRQSRIKTIEKAADLVLTLFPFEKQFYDQHGVNALCVGHPLADQIPLKVSKAEFRNKLNLDPDATYIAILPGSRQGELKYLSEIFIESAALCYKQRPTIKFITSAVNAKLFNQFKNLCEQIAPELPITFFQGNSHDVMAAADLVLVTSGTATLEAMLFKKPMVIAYRMGNFSFKLASYLVKIPYIGLPNLLANTMLVPEFIQDAANPNTISKALINYLDHPELMQATQNQFNAMHLELRKGAAHLAAQAIYDLI